MSVETTTVAPAGECKLGGGFGVFVQFLLLLSSVGVLVFKKITENDRKRVRGEKPRTRTLNVYLMDCSKQLIGAGWVHVMNMVAAAFMGNRAGGNACQWY